MRAFEQALQKLGWTDGHNVRIKARWVAADLERFRRYAAELVAYKLDVLLAGASSSLAVLQQATRVARE